MMAEEQFSMLGYSGYFASKPQRREVLSSVQLRSSVTVTDSEPEEGKPEPPPSQGPRLRELAATQLVGTGPTHNLKASQ